MEFKELMAEFGKKVGLANLVPNEDGLCELDTAFATVNVQNVPETGMVLISGMIRPVGPDPSSAMLRALLEANFAFKKTHGATLSIDPDENVVMLMRYERLADLDCDRFALIVTRFLEAMGEWTKWEEPENPGEYSLGGGPDSFYRVDG